jgi:hypothetical protein
LIRRGAISVTGGLEPEETLDEVHLHLRHVAREQGPRRGDRALQENRRPAAQGRQLLGRWINADFSGGTLLLETDDPKVLTEFSLGWSDVTELKMLPVIEDAELVDVLKRTGR